MGNNTATVSLHHQFGLLWLFPRLMWNSSLHVAVLTYWWIFFPGPVRPSVGKLGEHNWSEQQTQGVWDPAFFLLLNIWWTKMSDCLVTVQMLTIKMSLLNNRTSKKLRTNLNQVQAHRLAHFWTVFSSAAIFRASTGSAVLALVPPHCACCAKTEIL